MTNLAIAPAPEPDWAAIRLRYEAGTEKVADIAASIGLAKITLSNHALKSGWALRGAKARPEALPPASEVAEPPPPKRGKPPSTRETLRRLKELLQKRLQQLEQALGEISAAVEGQNNERDIRATNTLVRTLEKVLDIENRERKSRSKRARESARLNDAERDELARRIAGLCGPGPGPGAEPGTDDQRGAETAVGVDDLGAERPASPAG